MLQVSLNDINFKIVLNMMTKLVKFEMAFELRFDWPLNENRLIFSLTF